MVFNSCVQFFPSDFDFVPRCIQQALVRFEKGRLAQISYWLPSFRLLCFLLYFRFLLFFNYDHHVGNGSPGLFP